MHPILNSFILDFDRLQMALKPTYFFV